MAGPQRPITYTPERCARGSRNLIVHAESWRSWPGRGGLMAVVARRYVPFLLFTAMVAKLVFDVGVGRGPWFIYYDQASSDILGTFSVSLVVAIVLVYWSTLAAVYDERQHKTAVLLHTTPITAKEYLDGWIDWATRYRNPRDSLHLQRRSTGHCRSCWWTQLGWAARWAPHTSADQLDRIEFAIGLGLLTIVLVRCIACLAIWSSAGTRSWVSMQLNLACFLCPYVAVSALAWGIGWGVAGTSGAFLACLALTCAGALYQTGSSATRPGRP